jgi:FkbM family methyltransferase
LLRGKYYALRTLLTMITWFDNWGDVWACYRKGIELPPLRLRGGPILRHRSQDQALLQFYEVFRDHQYRRHISENEGSVMVDIGANVGFVTLDWAARLPNVRVHAYEPHPATFAVLRANVEMNCPPSRVSLHREAVGRESGEVTLLETALSMETSAYGAGYSANKSEEFKVPVVALDHVIERCQAEGTIGLVKIDAEGAEVDIIEGAQPETLRGIQQFVIEYHESLCADALGRCKRMLSGAGFHCITRPATPSQGLLYALRPTVERLSFGDRSS